MIAYIRLKLKNDKLSRIIVAFGRSKGISAALSILTKYVVWLKNVFIKLSPSKQSSVY